MKRPEFTGNHNSLADLAAFEQALREYEYAVQQEEAAAVELEKASMTEALERIIEERQDLFDRQLPKLIEGPPGSRGPCGAKGSDGVDNLDNVLVTVDGQIVIDEDGNIVTEGGTRV